MFQLFPLITVGPPKSRKKAKTTEVATEEKKEKGNAEKKKKKKGSKKRRLSKSDIGAPSISSFRHLQHVGFDPISGEFDVRQ